MRKFVDVLNRYINARELMNFIEDVAPPAGEDAILDRLVQDIEDHMLAMDAMQGGRICPAEPPWAEPKEPVEPDPCDSVFHDSMVEEEWND